MELILLGPPGAGKGTQAAALAEHYAVPHVSTGMIFRKNLRDGTPLGRRAQEFLDQGTLVPDDLTESMVADRLSEADARAGYILDGFPRNLAQARTHETWLKSEGRTLDAVVHLVVDRTLLMTRLTGRRVCPRCQVTYHVEFHPPKVQGVCDVCGTTLVQRLDDSPETVATRLQVYEAETAPLVTFYRALGLLQEFDGSQPVESVTEAIVTRLGGERP